jgi:hypothetical protein
VPLGVELSWWLCVDVAWEAPRREVIVESQISHRRNLGKLGCI